jgi:hypothetical protein
MDGFIRGFFIGNGERDVFSDCPFVQRCLLSNQRQVLSVRTSFNLRDCCVTEDDLSVSWVVETLQKTDYCTFSTSSRAN